MNKLKPKNIIISILNNSNKKNLSILSQETNLIKEIYIDIIDINSCHIAYKLKPA